MVLENAEHRFSNYPKLYSWGQAAKAHIGALPISSFYLNDVQVIDLDFGTSLPMLQSVTIIRPAKGEIDTEPVFIWDWF